MNWFLRISGINNYEYKIPDDRKEMLSDFYSMTLLDKNPKRYKNEDVGMVVNHVISSAIPKMKKLFLDDVFFAIVSELSHAFDEDSFSGSTHLESDDINIIFDNFVKRMNFNKIDPDELEDYISSSGSSHRSYAFRNYHMLKALEETGGSRYDVVKGAYILFSKSEDWTINFGGKNWAMICSGWMRLFNASSISEIIVAIDHLVDLEHNTGSLFDKLETWISNKDGSPDDNSWDWIEEFLDRKRESEGVVLDNLSTGFMPIFYRAYKDSHGRTREDRINESKEVDRWREIIDNDPDMLSQIPNKVLADISKNDKIIESAILEAKPEVLLNTSDYFIKRFYNSLYLGLRTRYLSDYSDVTIDDTIFKLIKKINFKWSDRDLRDLLKKNVESKLFFDYLKNNKYFHDYMLPEIGIMKINKSTFLRLAYELDLSLIDYILNSDLYGDRDILDTIIDAAARLHQKTDLSTYKKSKLYKNIMSSVYNSVLDGSYSDKTLNIMKNLNVIIDGFIDDFAKEIKDRISINYIPSPDKPWSYGPILNANQFFLDLGYPPIFNVSKSVTPLEGNDFNQNNFKEDDFNQNEFDENEFDEEPFGSESIIK